MAMVAFHRFGISTRLKKWNALFCMKKRDGSITCTIPHRKFYTILDAIDSEIFIFYLMDWPSLFDDFVLTRTFLSLFYLSITIKRFYSLSLCPIGPLTPLKFPFTLPNNLTEKEVTYIVLDYQYCSFVLCGPIRPPIEDHERKLVNILMID